jgi:replicative DNA helicase
VYPNLVKISSENAEEFKGIPTGFSKLDEITSGLNRSDLILIGARPAMGKTSFALNIGRNVGMTGKKVVFFSLEMSNEQLAARVLSTEARVESNKLRSGEISPDEFKFFIGKDIRLEQVSLNKEDAVNQLLRFYMGENTTERQNFIIENLRIDQDINEEMFEETEI